MEPPKDGDRVFPFKMTPSGNLKVDPNRVIFQSKNLGIISTDPKCTTVKVRKGSADSTAGSCAAHSLTELNEFDHAMVDPVDWTKVHFPEKSDMNKMAQEKISKILNTDCVVRVGKQDFRCHLLVLVSYSTYFTINKCEAGVFVLPQNEVSPELFRIIYNWMIRPLSHSRDAFHRKNVLDLYSAAQFLGITELEDQCWAFMLNEQVFTEESALMLYLQARKVGHASIMDLMAPRIMNCYLPLVSSPDYLHLPVDVIKLLLGSNYIAIHCEMEVFMSAIKWLFHNWKSRGKHAIPLMSCVRFGLISPWQLVDIRRNSENPEFLQVVGIPEVQKMLEDGLAYAINRCRYRYDTPEYHVWRDKLGLVEPDARNWVGQDRLYQTYSEFLDVLDSYRKAMLSRRALIKPELERTSEVSSGII